MCSFMHMYELKNLKDFYLEDWVNFFKTMKFNANFRLRMEKQ